MSDTRAEFDKAKDKENRRKHGMSLAVGDLIFDGLYFETVDRRRDYGELRLVAIGSAVGVGNPLLSVAYTWHGQKRRVISVRQPMATNDDSIVIVTPAMRQAARDELRAMIRDGRWVVDYEGEHDVDADDDIVRVTPAMAAAALAEMNEMIRAGRWPADYEGDDQLIFADDLPPAAHGTLKAAE